MDKNSYYAQKTYPSIHPSIFYLNAENSKTLIIPVNEKFFFQLAPNLKLSESTLLKPTEEIMEPLVRKSLHALFITCQSYGRISSTLYYM